MLGKFIGDVEGCTHDAGAGRTDQSGSPGEGVFADHGAVTRFAENIADRHAYFVEVDARRHCGAMSDGIEIVHHLHARRVARYHDH